MKKIILFGAIGAPIATLGISAAIVVPLIISEANPKDYTWNKSIYEANKAFSASEYRIDVNNHRKTEYRNYTSRIYEFNDSADINLFYNGAGTVTYSYFQRLALLAIANGKVNDKEVHFALSPDAWEHQAKTNRDYFEKLLKVANPKSSVINMHSDNRGTIINDWKRIIEANPNKKINVWWNSDHVQHENGSPDLKILDLAGYKNVNIQLMEDGAAIGYVVPNLLNTELQKQFNTPDDVQKMNNDTQYFAPKIFNNVYSWFSSSAFEQVSKVPGLERIKTFDAKDLADQIFNAKITLDEQQAKELDLVKGDNRLFKAWPKVTGLDWRNTLHIFEQAKRDRPGTKSLILLGSYGDPTEEDYIRDVWRKYHNEYNIFYKGHPGHSEHSRYILDSLIPSEAHEGMYVIESSIASEELTRDHIADGLVFDAVIALGGTSAIGGFPKTTYDLSKQFLERHDYDPNTKVDVTYVNGTQQFTDVVLKWVKESGWM